MSSRRSEAFGRVLGRLAKIVVAVVLGWLAVSAYTTFDSAGEIVRNMTEDANAKKLVECVDRLFMIGLFAIVAFGVACWLVVRGVRKIARFAEELQDVMRFMVHDLRTPIGHISNDADAMLDGRKSPLEAGTSIKEECNALLDKIETNAEITRNGFGYGKDAPERVDLTYVVESLVEYFELLAYEKGVEFYSDVSQDRIVVNAHERKLRLLVGALLDNAVKYTKQGSISVHFVRRGDGVRLVVCDTGCGISKEVQRKMYMRFFRGDPGGKVKGDGLGLAAVKSIVDFYGGEIECDSAVGNGTKFTVTLPLPQVKQ